MIRDCHFQALLLGFLVPWQCVMAQDAGCPPMDPSSEWARVSRAWSDESGLRWSNDSLRRVLLALGERDQSMRAEFGARVGDSLYARRLISLDSSLTADLEAMIDRFGLPTRAMVGAAGSDAAMLVVQHSATLQERVLAMARGLPAGSISPEKLAMLEDRVLVHQGKPQRYGTQFSLGTDGTFRFDPALEPDSLDAWRVLVGMPPMRAYVCLLEEAGMRVDHSSLPPFLRR